jgi:glycyl-tRNA synthetase beta chain
MVDRATLLFELGTEELPPKALKRLSEALTEHFVAGLAQAGLEHGQVESFATPRRLALKIQECALRQPDRRIERRGPAVQAAFDQDGNPTQAAKGFARSCGTTVDQLEKLETDKGSWLVYQVEESGQPASQLLPGIAEQALTKLPIPKRMRWGASEALFVRPVHWLLFLHGDQVVECTLLDARADRLTYGHRFHHPSAITIFNPDDYPSVLKDMGKVIAGFETRRQQIREAVMQSAAALGGHPDLDEDLLDEVTALNEWPVPISASFEERFLEVPQEALVATMKGNQKYFPLFNRDGKLMNHFITIANIDSPQPELIKEGNERVVRPRLADAMFFWQQDGKRRLEDRLESLRSVTFHQKLGSMYDKSVRVAELACYIAGRIGGDRELAQRAGMLSRCDLMTEMVYEFPEMQGIMGRYQARRDDEPTELAEAMDEFYMPRFSGDELPRTRTGIAIALAERIDTLLGIFAAGEKPTGDKDPFGLRRAALGALRIMKEHYLDLRLDELLARGIEEFGQSLDSAIEPATLQAEVRAFLLERLKGLYTEQGIPVESFQAVVGTDFGGIADFDRRLHAVIQFGHFPEAASLAAANKRIRNILRKADSQIPGTVDAALFRQEEEKRLNRQITDMTSRVLPLLEQGDYEGTLRALAELRGPVDDFFDQVMVMDDDLAVRGNRLALLNSLGNLFLEVADVSCLHS